MQYSNIILLVPKKRGTEMTESIKEQKRELHTFVFLSVILAPILSITIVGGYGFLIWISQIILGPPGTG